MTQICFIVLNIFLYLSTLNTDNQHIKMTDEAYQKLLGKKILSLRIQKEVSQVAMADDLDTYHTQIGRIERGEVNTSINMLRKIARYFGISIGELVEISADEKNKPIEIK